MTDWPRSPSGVMDDSELPYDSSEVFTPSITEVWYDDGNLILEAGDSRFRISKGILVSKSSVFREMASLPQPLDEELVEGCPLVCLHDSPQDLGYFLKAIYDSRYVSSSSKIQDPALTHCALNTSHTQLLRTAAHTDTY